MDSAKYIGMDVHKESISIAVRNAANFGEDAVDLSGSARGFLIGSSFRYIAVAQNDAVSLEQSVSAVARSEQIHLILRQSLLDNAVTSITALSALSAPPVPSPPASPVPSTPTRSERAQASIQSMAQGLHQWAEYQQQLRLARIAAAQRGFHCTSHEIGRFTYTDCN